MLEHALEFDLICPACEELNPDTHAKNGLEYSDCCDAEVVEADEYFRDKYFDDAYDSRND